MGPVTRPAAIFWDMDGTLSDSEPLWEEATFYLSELMGKRLTPQQRLATVGATFQTTADICAANAGITLQPGDYAHYRRLMFSKVKSLFADNLVVFPGVRELLAQLHAEDIPMLVATNTERYVAQGAIEVIGQHFFVDTICGDEVAQGKPAPDMYIEAARRVGADPADCLVFEDSATGMRAALDAGCRVVGLPASAAVEVPAGVVRIDSLHAHPHVAPATAHDVFRWFTQISGGVEPGDLSMEQ